MLQITIVANGQSGTVELNAQAVSDLMPGLTAAQIVNRVGKILLKDLRKSIKEKVAPESYEQIIDQYISDNITVTN